MLKRILGNALGVLLGGLLLVGGLALAAPTTMPLPQINGPFLGDYVNNLYTLTQAYQAGSAYGAVDLGSISQISGQANCTSIASINNSILHRVTTSASTGYVCLPTAYPGKIIYIANSTGQTVDLYSNATSYISGTADKINGTAGTTPFTGLTASNSFATCVAPVGGFWYCSATSNGASGPGAFTTLSASSTVSGTGFTNYFASPPAIGSTAAAPGTFTTLTFNTQLVSAGGTPTIASGACGTGTNGSLGAGSTNQSGEVVIASASTTSCAISFSATLAAAPLACVIFPENATAAATGTTVARVSAISTSGWTITGSALAGANYYYICL